MPPKRAAAKNGPAARSSGRKRRKPMRIDGDEPSEPQPTSNAPATDTSQEAAALSPAVLTALTEIVNNAIDRRLAPSTSAQTRPTTSAEVMSTQPAAPPTPTRPQAATPILQPNQSDGDAFASPTAAAVLAGLIDDDGESQGAPDNTQTQHSFDSITFVSSEVRAKIVKHEFFDLAQLLPKSIRYTHSESQILDISRGPNSSLTLTTKSRPQHINSLEQWMRCFGKYAFWRSQVYPEEAPGLFRHQLQVADLHTKYTGSKVWIEFDLAYRHHLANSDNFVWGDVLPGLLAEMRDQGIHDAARFFRPPQQRQQTARPPAIPKGYCFAFHRHNKCNDNPCQFSHKCPTCAQKGIAKMHSKAVCGKLKPAHATTQSTQPRSQSSTTPQPS